MALPDEILDRLVLVGGPPRSGTSFAARALNSHPRIVTAIDDHVFECWALYHYPTRTGLVRDLRSGPLSREDALGRLEEHLFSGGRFAGVAPSAKTVGLPLSPAPAMPRPAPAGRAIAERRVFPCALFAADWFCCLKSPEISYVLPRLAQILPTARLVLVHRPLLEIAESMFRKGQTVRAQPVFQRRWEAERATDGRRRPPPGVPPEWSALWNDVSDFQRCVLNAASYVKALGEGLASLPRGRFFLYDHGRLRRQGGAVLCELAAFLGVPAAGFAAAEPGIRRAEPEITDGLREQYREMDALLGLDAMQHGLAALESPAAAGRGAGGAP
jgi:hypothetical protein